MKLKTIAIALAALLAAGCAYGTRPPATLEVVSITPSDGSVAVTEQAVTVVFSRDVAPETIVGRNNLILVDEKNSLLRVSWTVSGSTVTVTPVGGFAAGKTYGAAVRTGVCDLEGGPLRYPRASRFSTGDAVSEIPGFPPFDEYPLAPVASKIKAELRGALIEVRGSSDSVERPSDSRPVNVNLRNLTGGGEWLAVAASWNGSFAADLPAGSAGDQIELCSSFPSNGNTGPSVTVTVTFPFMWLPLSVAGTAPSARQGHSAVYHPASHRMIVFGGCGNSFGFGSVLNDVHALSLSPGSEAWSELSPSGAAPPARFGHTAVLDASGNRMIVFGGDNGALGVLNDAWSLDLTPGAEAWSPVAAVGAPPSGRAFHTAVFDDASSSMLVFCGRGALSVASEQYDDLFELSFPAAGTPSWLELAPAGTSPIARNGAFGVLDSSGSTLYAGFGGTGPLYLPDTYSLSVQTRTWSPILSVPTTSGRAYSCAVFDTVHQRVLVFGGADGTAVFSDLFQYSPAASSWTTLVPEGSPPSARAASSLVFDSAGGRSLLFGGREAALGQVLGDLYQLR